MVCLPLSRMMSSQQSERRSASVSPGRTGRNSTNIETITCDQPSRIRESVPSKSKSTWLGRHDGWNVGANSTAPRKEVDENIWLSGYKWQVACGMPARLERQLGAVTETIVNIIRILFAAWAQQQDWRP